MSRPKEDILKDGMATRWKKGEAPKSPGRPPFLKNVIKAMPPDAKEKVGLMMWTALTMKDTEEALAYFKGIKESGAAPECGIVLELCIKGLSSQQGWQTLRDIYAILFGTPRQSADVAVSGEMDYHFKFGEG